MLPKASFAVFKARPGDMHKIVNTRTDSAAGSDVTAEFGMRWSLEHLLNSFFTSILAVESLEHDPMPVAKGSSLPYVRQLHHHLPIDSEDYSKLENFSVRSHALENAAEEATSGPRSQWLDSAEEHGEAEMNPLLRLAHFVRHQIELASHYCLVCHAPMVVLGVRPFVCDNPLCVHQFEELGLGANPDVEVEKNPEVVDLLISLCWHYVSKAPALENMPSWKMLRGFRRCTGTLDSFEFNSSSATGPDMSAIPNTQSCLRLTGRDAKLQSELKAGDSIRIVAADGVGWMGSVRGNHEIRLIKDVNPSYLELEQPFTFPVDGTQGFEVLAQDSNEDSWDIGFEVASVIDRLPKVSEMQKWVEQGATIKSKLDQKDGRLFPVLRWILCSFRVCVCV